ncbi:MAG TPA: hypothetical protein DCY00_02775 [Actinobacteria bacterium]|nr:hypothetical protein [Actinomycetota bacterium]
MNTERDTFKDYILQTPNFLTLFLVPVSFLSIAPALIEIARELHTTPETMNLVFTFFPAGMVAGQLTSVFYNRRFKRSLIILTSYILLILINLVLFFAQHFVIYFVLSIFCGYLLGINYVQSTENILACKVKNKDRLVTLMVTFYPIGALVAPFLSSLLVRYQISWRYTYIIIAALILITAVLYSLLSLKGQNRIIANTVQRVSFKEIFKDRDANISYIIILLVVLIYIVGESVFGNWTPTYLRLAKGLDIQSAALGVTLFNIFIVIGRFIASSLAGKVSAKTILLAISIIAIISAVFFVMSDTKLFIYITISLVGLGYSAMYPLLVSTGSTIYEKGRGILSSMIFAAGYGGKTITPFITKAIAERNLTFSILVATIFSGIAAMLIIFLIVFEKRRALTKN